MRLELPQYYTGDEQLRALYAYLTRTVDKLNYALAFLDVPDESNDAGIRAEDPNNKSIKLSEKSTNTQYPSAKAVVDYAVPKTRAINGKTLENDITLDADDVGAVPTARKINGYALDEDVVLEPADLGEAGYIAETGSSGAWSWRKWSSGEVELWATGLSVALGAATSWTSELVYQNGTFTYPIALRNGADANVQVTVSKPQSATEINGLVLVAIKQDTGAQIRFVRKAAASAVYLDIYVRGIAQEEP